MSGAARRAPWQRPEAAAWEPLHAALPQLPAASAGSPWEAPPPPGRPAAAAAAAGGTAAATAAAEALTARLHAALAEVATLRRRLLADSEAEVVRLALSVARALMQHDADGRAAVVARLTHEALALLVDADEITLRLPPGDGDALLGRHPELLERPNLRLLDDPTLRPGGVVAECALGRVDAGLEARLEALAAALLGDAQGTGEGP